MISDEVKKKTNLSVLAMNCMKRRYEATDHHGNCASLIYSYSIEGREKKNQTAEQQTEEMKKRHTPFCNTKQEKERCFWFPLLKVGSLEN